MKKLVLTILALIALFSALRAYTESVAVPGVSLHPGLVEIGDGSSSIGIAFGVMESRRGAGHVEPSPPPSCVQERRDECLLGLTGSRSSCAAA